MLYPSLPHSLNRREVNWRADPWIGGAFNSDLTPGAWAQYMPALRAPVGRVFWAGTEMAARWPVSGGGGGGWLGVVGAAGGWLGRAGQRGEA